MPRIAPRPQVFSNAHQAQPARGNINRAHKTVALSDAIATLESHLANNTSIKPIHTKTQLTEIRAIQQQTRNMRDVRVIGATVLAESMIDPVISFNSIVVDQYEGDEWTENQIPLHSRTESLEAHTIDLTKRLEDHGNHQHAVWQSNNAQQTLLGNAIIQIGQNQEGCPCCTAGLDFDEFASAIDQFREQSQIQNSEINGQHHLAHAPDFNSPVHWGVVLGLSAPFALVGLCAAVRNISGGLQNRQSIQRVIRGLDQDIKKNTNPDVVNRLKAFRKSLAYSKFDANWNIAVPGAINGVASSLVISTAVVAHPFALGAIAAYATAQMGRNTFDFVRNLQYQPQLSDATQSSIEQLPQTAQAKALVGFTKATQISRHKSIFYAANTVNFAIFSVGALLTLLSIPAIAVAGLGIPTMIGGLTLLTFGATATGIGNNIWPRKFRPRNGDIRMDRSQLTGPTTLLAIEKAQTTKQRIKARKKHIFTEHTWQKRWIKIKTALPELTTFLPNRVASLLAKPLFFLPNTGSAAVAEKHTLNKAMVAKIHDSSSAYSKLQNARVGILQQLALDYSASETTLETKPATLDAEIQDVWQALKNTQLAGPMLETWLNEGYAKAKHDHTFTPDHGHQVNANATNTCCGRTHQVSDMNIHGISERTKSWHTFSIEEFLAHSNKQDKQSFLLAVDYHLFFVLRNTASYTERSLVDFYALTHHSK